MWWKQTICLALSSISQYATAGFPGQNAPGQLEAPKHRENSNTSSREAMDNHSIWSAVPLCLGIGSESERLCLYTSTTFANGRGISILTTNDQVTELLKLPAFIDTNIHSSLHINELSYQPFIAREIEGRGVGLIANRTIKHGEWLMSFTPAFMSGKNDIRGITYADRLRLQNLALKQLPSYLRSVCYTLYGQKGSAAYDVVDDILSTNTFELDLDCNLDDAGKTSEVSYMALFPEIARFNHDCRPNADYFFDTQTLVLHITAYRNIFAGEELTISYVDPLQKREARQQTLHRSWGFTCNCTACSAPPKLVEVSDARIDNIIQLQEKLVDRSEESEGSPVLAERLVYLLQRERLWTLIHDGYFSAAVEYNGIGDAVNARRYAQLALKSNLLCRGSEPPDDWYRDMLLLERDPPSHPSWKFRIFG